MKTTAQALKLPLVFSLALFSIMPVEARSPNPAMPTVDKSSTLSSPYAYQPPPPPRRVGSPGKRSDGGARTGCGGNLSKPLTALVPIDSPQTSGLVFGVTTVERPTFWFDLPYQAATTGTFQLRDEQKQIIYETSLTLPGAPGVIHVTLPDTAPSLAVGKPYHWYFKVSCGSGTDFVDGWIQRKPLNAKLQKQLEQATLTERSRLYSNNGIWFEALTTAAELRRRDPKSNEWATLLKAVGLEEITSAPIVDCCNMGDR